MTQDADDQAEGTSRDRDESLSGTAEAPSGPGMPDDSDEGGLVERARNRDYDAFEILAARHQARIYRLAVRMTGNPSDAQEVVQDALLSSWKNLPGFEGKAQFGSWLYRIAANAALMLLRSRRRHPQISVEDLAPDAMDRILGEDAERKGGGGDDWTRRPDQQFQSAELRAHIQKEVLALPPGAREVFVLRDLEGLSTEEAAEMLGVSAAAVKTRLHRARLALRASISAYFADRP